MIKFRTIADSRHGRMGGERPRMPTFADIVGPEAAREYMEELRDQDKAARQRRRTGNSAVRAARVRVADVKWWNETGRFQ